MNENFILDIFVNGAASLDNVSQLRAVGFVILGLSVDHVNEGAAVSNGRNIGGGGLLKVVGAWEVLDGELDVGVVIDQSRLDLVSGDQEKGLMGRHLLEDNTLNGGLA